MTILKFLPKAAIDAQHMSGLITLAGNEIIALRAELSRCVFLLNGACTLPDGSNADTSNAHALLGDFESRKTTMREFLFSPEVVVFLALVAAALLEGL